MKCNRAHRPNSNRVSQVAALAAGLLGLAGTARADGSDEHRVVFEDTYLETGYTAVGINNAAAAQGRGTFASLEAGWHFDPELVLGIMGDVLIDKIAVTRAGAGNLDVNYLGLFGEWNAYSRDLFTVSARVASGWGQAGYRFSPVADTTSGSDLTASAASGERTYVRSSVGFFEPSVVAMAHISHRLDFGPSAGYRVVRGGQLDSVAVKSLGGAMVGVVLRGNF